MLSIVYADHYDRLMKRELLIRWSNAAKNDVRSVSDNAAGRFSTEEAQG